MSIKNIIADSDSFFSLPVKYVFYKYFNKYYKVNDIIEAAEIDSEGDLLIELKSGLKISSPPSKYEADHNFTERYKYGDKSKMDKIIDVERFFFLYEVLSELYINNEYFVHYDLQKGDVVIDAGANIGGFTLQASRKVGDSGRIYAIEPNEDNRRTLQKNLKLNNINNCIILTEALWSEKCTKKFFISHRPGEHTLINYDGDSHFHKQGEITINCEKLDDLLIKYNIENIKYLKMDIEGAEIEAIKGAGNLLETQSPYLHIEALHEVNGKPAYLEVIKSIERHGYKLKKEVDNYRGTISAVK
ncbi:MAG: FkbM family methyltransferase [Candidatus Kapaibacterium sp.]